MVQLIYFLQSKQAILIYEILILAVLAFFIVLLSKKRKQRKLTDMALKEQEKRELLEESLANPKRG